ncbi:MAG: TonB-dependent receptor, partial [Pseudomonadota bacterium]
MKFRLLLAIAGVLTPMLSSANEDDSASIEEIVVTGELSRFGATRSATPIVETARSVSVIDESEFRTRGALTVDDTLNFTAGVVGDTFGFSTRGDFAKVRGFDAAEYRDGQQVLFGFYNNTRSDVYMLEQVEVLKGPASVLYGRGTPGGIVNSISKIARPGNDNEVLLDFGSQSRYQISTDLNAQLGDNWFARVVGIYRDADTQVDNVIDDALVIMPSITYQTDTTSLTALVEYADRDSDTSHQFLPLTGTACVDSRVTVTPAAVCNNASGEEIELETFLGQPGFNRYDTTSTLVSLLGSHAFSDVFSVEGVVRYKDGEADYRQAWIDFLGAGNPRIGADGNGGRTFYLSDASSEQFAADLRARFAFDTGAFSHEVFAGVVYQNAETDNDLTFLSAQGTLDVFDPVYGALPAAFASGEPVFDGPASTTDDRGLYLSDQISWQAWRFNVGVRFDETETESGGSSQEDSETSFSVGALYAFDNGLSPYASFAESFQPVIGVNSVTGAFLQPRRGEQIEVGLKYQPVGTRTFVTVAYFEIEESNLPNPSSLITDPDLQQEGIGEATGVEIEAQTRVGDWFFEGNLSVLDTESAEGVPFDSIPDSQFSGWVQYEPSDGQWNGFRFGLGLRIAG